jgi:hypothetical protein
MNIQIVYVLRWDRYSAWLLLLTHMRDGIELLQDRSFNVPNPFTSPDDPGVQSRRRSRIETGTDSVSLRLISRLSSAMMLVIGIPLLGWFGTQVYGLVMAQLQANTSALVQNQEFIRDMALEQSLQRAKLDGVGEDMDNLRESQSRIWARYGDINLQLVRLKILHERSD